MTAILASRPARSRANSPCVAPGILRGLTATRPCGVPHVPLVLLLAASIANRRLLRVAQLGGVAHETFIDNARGLPLTTQSVSRISTTSHPSACPR
jgi:hypothetical protein